MVKDMTAVVAAAGPHRGIGYQGQMVRGDVGAAAAADCGLSCRMQRGTELLMRNDFALSILYHSRGNYQEIWNISSE
jgi:hypothetical protein